MDSCNTGNELYSWTSTRFWLHRATLTFAHDIKPLLHQPDSVVQAVTLLSKVFEFYLDRLAAIGATSISARSILNASGAHRTNTHCPHIARQHWL
jgi:hypothetical protein